MKASAPSDHLPWRRFYPGALNWEAPLPARPLHAYLDRSAETHGGRPALDFLGRRLTYAELRDQVHRVAEGFRRLGVTRGTRVGLCLPNSPFSVIAFYAVLRAGGTVVNFNPLYTAEEISRQVRDSGTTIMVTIDLAQVYPKVNAALESDCGLEKIVICRMSEALPTIKGALFGVLKRSELAPVPKDARHTDFATLRDSPPLTTPAEIDPARDLAVLQYTGGTTGVPKGAMLTHANIATNTEQLLAWAPDLNAGQERVLGILPFFHVLAMTVVLNFGVAMAGELILLPRFDLNDTLKTIHRKKPTFFPGVPTVYTAINGAKDLKRYDLSSLRYCISGGAPLPLEVKKEFERLTGCTLVEGYGLSEASPVVCCNPLTGHARTGAIGLPLPGTAVEMRSIEDPRSVVDIGERGELCVKGPQVMAGYWNRPEETGDVLIDGWLRTGDVGHLDADGFVHLTDRIKDVILCSGFNVYPRVIEEAIYEHPAVAQVAVIGVPDPYRGQSPKAFIRLRPDAEVTEAELKQFLSEKISRIEMPRAFAFREELPTTMVGKLSKKALQEEEAARRAPGTSEETTAPGDAA